MPRKSGESADSRKRYEQVAETLIGEIRGRKIGVGDTLPGELELTERFGVSRHTVREALRKLEELGLIDRQQGVGTVVRARQPVQSYVQAVRSPAELLQYPPESKLVVVGTGDVRTTRKLARQLGCATGTKWFRISCIRRLRDSKVPICWVDVYVLPDYASIADVVGRRQPVYEAIEQRFGQQVAAVDIDIRAGLVAGRDREAARCRAGHAEPHRDPPLPRPRPQAVRGLRVGAPGRPLHVFPPTEARLAVRRSRRLVGDLRPANLGEQTMNRSPARREPAGYRSWLFTPANHARRVEKVFQSGADVAILDLEDAVAPAEKPAARAAAVEALARPRTGAGYVRVNGFDTEWCHADLQAVVAAGVDGIVLPKVEGAQELCTLDWLVGQLERERGLAPGAIDLVPLIETAAGIAALEAICGATPRVSRLAFGGADYTADLDLVWTADETEFSYARARLTHCSRVAGLEPPVDTVVVQIRDHDRFRAAARRGRQLGFQGKLCIHPDQVPLANEVFGPTPDEVAHARMVVDAWSAAQRQGLASIQLDGHFVDPPIAARARRILAVVERDAKRACG
jgi:citrate lyase subunit beta / citryl-CoA lyase